ncbi:hypothetical protein BURPS1106B_1984 [Burkholderia pseudomallei 1106b]|uniref:Uncharacterized protein n=1 Tax=Burkholderia pseudomallei (strain 1106a) TaxID=357348 RepID=A3P140_BURP0|nr:hypothetical protein BURPS1106A_A0007 [Burkholderia pseudomallei 1106a]EEP50775.1 conserved hypothetical protein [Burkholderia pseudomallei MSHR346]EES23043.1 hypothetical protein BURPS1106B_1984 [Burkholderia pseudomallei 1106b]
MRSGAMPGCTSHVTRCDTDCERSTAIRIAYGTAPRAASNASRMRSASRVRSSLVAAA